MKFRVHMLAALLVLFVTAAVAQKPMDQASEKAVKITQGPTIADNNGTTATLTWTTDREGANHVQYRKAGSNEAWKSAYHSGGGTNHTLQLTGLTAGQTYEYQILTRDGDVRTSGQFQAGSGNGTAANTSTPTSTPTSSGAPATSAGDKVALYREVGPGGVHTFTTTATAQPGFNNEGIAGYVLNSQKSGTVPLYRLTNSKGDTLLTTNESERGTATAQGYRDEGVVGYVASNRWGGTQPLYRMFGNGGHFYTTSDQEHGAVLQQGYHDESTLGYVWSQQ
jgi:Repeat of unknown function (DUF5648)/Fibronectin type III domain